MKRLIIGALLPLTASLAFAATTRFGNVQTANLTATGTVTLGTATDVTTSTPSVVGQLVRTSANVLYISTGTATPYQWAKVGAQ